MKTIVVETGVVVLDETIDNEPYIKYVNAERSVLISASRVNGKNRVRIEVEVVDVEISPDETDIDDVNYAVDDAICTFRKWYASLDRRMFLIPTEITRAFEELHSKKGAK